MPDIEKEFAEILGPIADPSNMPSKTFEQSVDKLFEVLLRRASPKSNIEYGIALGLLVKSKKLFNSVQNAISSNDMLAFSILARSLYETSISLRYFLAYSEEENTAKLFILGDAMGQRYQLKQKLKSEKITKKEFENGLKNIVKNLQTRNIDIKELPKGPPKSWHPTKSYRELAKDLDSTGEALEIYDSLYSTMSKDTHPSIHDIMRWHVTQFDDNAPFIPNLHIRYSSDIEIVLTACMMYSMFETYVKYTEGCEDYNKLITAFHTSLHISFNSKKPTAIQSIEGFERYAAFWLQNYPGV